ncbi:hypothetical protein E3983_10540 [Legionella israelensis]|uniref:Uncharacterized protein n=1 Tax=Legionella israelensis TaxID=454 RepID=A0AAX1EI42_9GAMM|nr:hypothetical protein [Legionella israelensis]QBR84752.1 hypothetical protein E3983_10540 [Legionella israelensis]
MAAQECWELYDRMRIRLANKGYTEVRPAPPMELGFLKQTMGGLIPKVIAFINATHSTDMPTETFKRSMPWFKNLLGNNGAAVLIYIYWQPSAALVNEVMQLGKGSLGYGQVVAGVYDLSSNQYWMSDHMGWPNEIFH